MQIHHVLEIIARRGTLLYNRSQIEADCLSPLYSTNIYLIRFYIVLICRYHTTHHSYLYMSPPHAADYK